MRYGAFCFLVLCYITHTPSTTLRRERSIGGQCIFSHKYPWVVSIYSLYVNRSEPNEAQGYMCTGSIIDVYGTIITAAHCVDDTLEINLARYKLDYVWIKWGSYMSHYSNPNDGIFARLSLILRHPRSYTVHQERTLEDIDIALIFLDEFQKHPINCSDPTLKPIDLSGKDEISKPTYGIVAGFGCQPNITLGNCFSDYIDPYYANLAELSFRYCCRSQSTRNVTYTLPTDIRTSSAFSGYAIGSENDPLNLATGETHCGVAGGDSGGPYMEDEEGQNRLRGILHRTSSLTGPYRPASSRAAFMDINYYLTREWILQSLHDRYNYTGVPASYSIPRTCTKDRGRQVVFKTEHDNKKKLVFI